MELWIRSQDKSALVKTDNVLFNTEELEICSVLTTQCSKISLGKYKSEERVLEILDEIQELIKPTFKINYEYDDNQPIMNGEWFKSLKAESKIEELSCYVYEMPKE